MRVVGVATPSASSRSIRGERGRLGADVRCSREAPLEAGARLGSSAPRKLADELASAIAASSDDQIASARVVGSAWIASRKRARPSANATGTASRSADSRATFAAARSSSRTASSASTASSLIAGSGSWWLNLAHSKRSVSRRTEAALVSSASERALDVLERRLRRLVAAAPRAPSAPLHAGVRGDDRAPQVGVGAQVVERLVERRRDASGAPTCRAAAVAAASGQRRRLATTRRAGARRGSPELRPA